MMTRMKDLQQNNMKEEEYFKLMIFFCNFIQGHGEQLKLRQQVISSAIVYFRRFYAKYTLKSVDPFLLAPTCIFLATKVEEFGLLDQRRYSTHAANLLKAKYSHLYPQEYPYKINNIWECEFYLLEVMDCCLILYHPYRCLQQYINDLCPDDTSLLQAAWTIVNDSYRTDACLLYPPSLIALSCIHMAAIMQKKDKVKDWFADLNVDMDKIFEITRHLMHLYEVWKTYDEKEQLKEILSKVPKPRLASRPASQSTDPQPH